TDFWLECAIANGVNLPVIEYTAQTGGSISRGKQTVSYVWFNTDRDPFGLICYPWQVLRGRFSWHRYTVRYWAPDDLRPFAVSLVLDISSFCRRLARKLFARSTRSGSH